MSLPDRQQRRVSSNAWAAIAKKKSQLRELNSTLLQFAACCSHVATMSNRAIFYSALPLTDAALAETIGAAKTVEIRRDNAMLLDVVRVLRAAPHITTLIITDLAILRHSEANTLVYGQEGSLSYQMKPSLPAHDLWDLERSRPASPGLALERLEVTGKIQAGCYRQTEWLVKALLYESFNLRQLKLNMFEYPTDGLPTQLKKDFPLPVPALPSLLGMNRQPTEKEKALAEEGRRIGEAISESILKYSTQRIENRPSDLELALNALFANAAAAIEPLGTASDAIEPRKTASMVPYQPTVPGLMSGRELFENMTHMQYDDLMQTLYTTHLPRYIQSLSMRVVLRGRQVKADFLFLPYATDVDIQFCEIDDDAFAAIAPVISRRMPALQRLNLARNRLQYAELGEMIGPALKTLDCTFNPITSKAAGHLFRAMALNDWLHEVDLSFTRIDNSLSFVGLHRWTASPALLRIPFCLSDDDLMKASMYVHEGVEIEMISETSMHRLREHGLRLLK